MLRSRSALGPLLLVGAVGLGGGGGCFPLPAPADPDEMPTKEGKDADSGDTKAPAGETAEAQPEASAGASAGASGETEGAEAPSFDFPAIANDAPQLKDVALNAETDLGEGVFLTVHARNLPAGDAPQPWVSTQSKSDTFSVLMPDVSTDYTLRARDPAGVDWFTHAIVADLPGGASLNVNCHQRSDGPVAEAIYEEQLVGAMMEAGGEVAKLESAEMRAYELVNDKGTHLRSWWTQGQICTARFDAPSNEALPSSEEIGKVFESFSMAAAQP